MSIYACCLIMGTAATKHNYDERKKEMFYVHVNREQIMNYVIQKIIIKSTC